MDSFTSTVHHASTAQTDPSAVTLPTSFAVCVIGASSGIGEHIAYAYAHAHATSIAICARSTLELERVAAQIRTISPTTTILEVDCDITSSANVASLASTLRASFGRLDVLVANSGYAGPVTLRVTDGEPEWFQQNFDVNAVGTYHAAHHLIPLLLGSEQGAKAFVVVGSLAADIVDGPIANTGYCLSKFAQSRFVEFVGEQFGKEGLVAVNVHPGAVMTKMAAGNTPDVFLPCESDDPWRGNWC